MEALQWAVGVLVTIQLGVTGFIMTKLWAHIEKCTSTATLLASISADVERMKQDIGTHDTGMRGHIHKVAQLCQENELTLSVLKNKQ